MASELDKKQASEAANAASDVQHDSAAAAALTVGETATAAPKATKRSHLGAGIVAALSAVLLLIGGAAVALQVPTPLNELFGAGQQQEQAVDDESAYADSSNAADTDDGATEETPDEAEASDEPSDEAAGDESASDGQTQDAATGGAAATTGGASSGSASSSQSPSQQSSGSGSSASSSSGSQGAAQVSTVTVTVSVSSSAVGNPVSGSATPTFNKGATVYDALCAVGLSVNASNTAYGVYVAAIGGLAEKEHGSTSGWMYSVNGATPMTACSNYVLKNGDVVQWYYVTG